jgi:hypothetical protein
MIPLIATEPEIIEANVSETKSKFKLHLIEILIVIEN